MKELSEVEKLFVMEVLDTHGEYVVNLLHDVIIERSQSKDEVLIKTAQLIESLHYKVDRQGSDYVLSVSFMSYGRAVEIAFFKSRRLRRDAKSAKNDAKNLRRAKQKDTRFYAKNVYGSINRLLGRMSSEYGDAEIARLKGILENRMTSSLTQ